MSARHVTQRVKVRSDGQRFVLTRWEWPTVSEAQVHAAQMTASATEGAQYEVVAEDRDAVPPAPPPPAPAPTPDPQIAIDKSTVVAFMTAASGTATAVQRDEVIKAVIRYLRRSGQDA